MVSVAPKFGGLFLNVPKGLVAQDLQKLVEKQPIGDVTAWLIRQDSSEWNPEASWFETPFTAQHIDTHGTIHTYYSRLDRQNRTIRFNTFPDELIIRDACNGPGIEIEHQTQSVRPRGVKELFKQYGPDIRTDNKAYVNVDSVKERYAFYSQYALPDTFVLLVGKNPKVESEFDQEFILYALNQKREEELQRPYHLLDLLFMALGKHPEGKTPFTIAPNLSNEKVMARLKRFMDNSFTSADKMGKIVHDSREERLVYIPNDDSAWEKANKSKRPPSKGFSQGPKLSGAGFVSLA